MDGVAGAGGAAGGTGATGGLGGAVVAASTSAPDILRILKNEGGWDGRKRRRGRSEVKQLGERSAACEGLRLWRARNLFSRQLDNST